MRAAPDPALAPPCAAHGAPAGWRCASCDRALCPACARTVRVGYGPMVVCNACGGYGTAITVPRRYPPVGALLRDVLLYPFRGGGWLFVGVLGLLLAALKVVWIAGTVPAALLTGLYLYFAAVRSAEGWDELPPAADFSRGRDALAGLWSTLSAFAFAATPACWYLLERAHRLPFDLSPASPARRPLTLWTTPLFKVDGFVFDANLLLLSLPILLWLPAVLLLALAGAPMTEVVNPMAALRTYAALGRKWVLLAGALLLAVVIGVAAGELIDFHWMPRLGLPNPLSEMVALSAALMCARLFGLVLFVEGQAVGFRRPGDFRDAVLGDTLPPGAERPEPGQAAAALPPIDLPLDAEEPSMEVSRFGDEDPYRKG